MNEKRRFNVTLPNHVADEVERHARNLGAAPTEYAGDIIRRWFGEGCPPISDEDQRIRDAESKKLKKKNSPITRLFEAIEQRSRVTGSKKTDATLLDAFATLLGAIDESDLTEVKKIYASDELQTPFEAKLLAQIDKEISARVSKTVSK